MKLLKSLSVLNLFIFTGMLSDISLAGEPQLIDGRTLKKVQNLNDFNSPLKISIPDNIQKLAFHSRGIRILIKKTTDSSLNISWNNTPENMKLHLLGGETLALGESLPSCARRPPIEIKERYAHHGEPELLATVDKFPEGMTEKDFCTFNSLYEVDNRDLNKEVVTEKDFITFMRPNQNHVIGKITIKNSVRMEGVVYASRLWQGTIIEGHLEFGGKIYGPGAQFKEGKYLDPNLPPKIASTDFLVEIPENMVKNLKIIGKNNGQITLENVPAKTAEVTIEGDSRITIKGGRFEHMSFEGKDSAKLIFEESPETITIGTTSFNTKEPNSIVGLEHCQINSHPECGDNP